ncbi:hypothetical protein Y1Q_0019540 [Alligator mississippiensis]|uniref:PH domain-containing protein n=1 Tax=Alligator mississippiensis TaxID=8496 RepID=A0A151NMS1_ALLMI|nr:hypothetical protein Y1Q_0019540 [Alligator mississippiensis]
MMEDSLTLQDSLGSSGFLCFCEICETAILGESIGLIMDEHNGPAENSLPSQGWHHAIKCGWLRKQGGFVKTWRTRWFVLKRDQLYYFKDEDETKPLGTIFLPGNRVIEHACNEESPGKFLFEVIPEIIEK